jgi:hypothetical protein
MAELPRHSTPSPLRVSAPATWALISARGLAGADAPGAVRDQGLKGLVNITFTESIE